jgi:hypothetical protein
MQCVHRDLTKPGLNFDFLRRPNAHCHRGDSFATSQAQTYLHYPVEQPPLVFFPTPETFITASSLVSYVLWKASRYPVHVPQDLCDILWGVQLSPGSCTDLWGRDSCRTCRGWWPCSGKAGHCAMRVIITTAGSICRVVIMCKYFININSLAR